jgi:hypothetical protein
MTSCSRDHVVEAQLQTVALVNTKYLSRHSSNAEALMLISNIDLATAPL